jgi:hypothetical protein
MEYKRHRSDGDSDDNDPRKKRPRTNEIKFGDGDQVRFDVHSNGMEKWEIGAALHPKNFPEFSSNNTFSFSSTAANVPRLIVIEDEYGNQTINQEDPRLRADWSLNTGGRPGWFSSRDLLEDEGKNSSHFPSFIRPNGSGGSITMSRYMQQLRAVDEQLTAEHKERKQTHEVRLRSDVKVNPNRSQKSKGEQTYDAVINMYHRIAAANGFQLEAMQEEFLEEFVAACAPLIYGEEEWITQQIKWKQKHNRTKIHRQVFCLTPRRFGKTTSVQLFVLALALVVPGIRIVILSQNGRTSRALLDLCSSSVRLLEDEEGVKGGYAKRKVASQTAETISFLSDDDSKLKLTADERRRRPNRSTIVACPSTANGTYSLFLSLFHFFGRSSSLQQQQPKRKKLKKIKVCKVFHSFNYFSNRSVYNLCVISISLV